MSFSHPSGESAAFPPASAAAGQLDVVVDIGNHGAKVGGLIDAAPPGPGELPRVENWGEFRDEADLATLLERLPRAPRNWFVVSVQRAREQLLRRLLHELRPRDGYRLLTRADFPWPTRVDFPQRVGVDRLAGAAGANLLRDPRRPALVVDAGTAITVDWVDVDGGFAGGAILPGLGLAASALAAGADLLPRVNPRDGATPPAPLGKHTEAAIRSGVFWGAVGGVRELATRLVAASALPPDCFITGGDGPLLADHLPRFRQEPTLVLAGVAHMARGAAPPGG